MSELPWRVWIDTGGTFTDCIAVRGDEVRRRKVLSSGRLQTRVLACEGNTVDIQPIEGSVAGFLRGFEVYVAGPESDHSNAVSVVDHQRIGGRLDRLLLSAPLHAAASDDEAASTVIQLAADLEAPVVGIHLLLGTVPGDDLPALELRLGTTRGTNALLERKGVRPHWL